MTEELTIEALEEAEESGYEEAWAKRNKTTAGFKVQLEKDMAIAHALPSDQQFKAVTAAADRYDDACKPAVEEWQRDLGILEE